MPASETVRVVGPPASGLSPDKRRGKRPLVLRDEEARGGPGPPERGLPGRAFLRSEPRTEERRRRVAHRDDEEAPVAEHLGHAAAAEPGLPERVAAVRRLGLGREVRETHEALVRLARRRGDLRVGVSPRDEPALPALRPEEGMEILVRDDRLAARVDPALERPDRGDRRGLLVRARHDVGPRFAGVEARSEQRRAERERPLPQNAFEARAHREREHDGEGDRVARHGAAVEEPERQERRHEDHDEVHDAAAPPEEQRDEPDRRDEEHGSRAPRREEVTHEKRVRERSERAGREGVRTEARALGKGRHEPGPAARLGEEPGGPGGRPGGAGPEERDHRVAAVPPVREAAHAEEERRPEREDEVGPHARPGGGEESRRDAQEARAARGDHLAPARLVRRTALVGEREAREGAEEEGRGRGVRESAAAVHPDDGKGRREDDARQRRPPADGAAAPHPEREEPGGGENRRRRREGVERRHAERQERASEEDPHREAGRLRREVEEVEVRHGAREDGLVDLTRRGGDREEARGGDAAEDEPHESLRRTPTPLAGPPDPTSHAGKCSIFRPASKPLQCRGCRSGSPRDDRSPHPPSRRAPHFARIHRSRRSSGALPAASRRLQGVPRGRIGARPHDGPHAEGLRHRHGREAAGGPAPLPELARDRAALPPRPHPLRGRQARRGLHVPQDARRRAGRTGAGRRRGSPHPLGQHVRDARGGRGPPRLHDQRALLRHRDLRRPRLRRRRRRPRRPRRAHDRRSAHPVPRGPRAHAPGVRVRGAPFLRDGARAARRDRRAPPRGDEERGPARHRGASRPAPPRLGARHVPPLVREPASSARFCPRWTARRACARPRAR